MRAVLGLAPFPADQTELTTREVARPLHSLYEDDGEFVTLRGCTVWSSSADDTQPSVEMQNGWPAGSSKTLR